MNKTKMGFFSRIKKAIFKFDEYEGFVIEETKVAVFYLLKLILIFSIFVTIALYYNLNINMYNAATVLEEQLPNFEIKNGILQIEKQEESNIYIEDLNMQFIMNQNAENPLKTEYANSLEFLKDKMILNYEGTAKEIRYNELDLTKIKLIEYMNSMNTPVVVLSLGLVFCIITYIMYLLIFLLDIFMLSILGYIINIFIRTQFKLKELFKISIYSMTLPIFLYLIYTLANLLFGITIKYFELAYNTISYIYIVTALLIIKSDLIKTSQELLNILEEEKKVKEELAREKEEERKKQEEANRDKKEEKEKEKKKKKNAPKGEPQTEN